MTHKHHEHTSDFFKFLILFVIAVVGFIIYRALR